VHPGELLWCITLDDIVALMWWRSVYWKKKPVYFWDAITNTDIGYSNTKNARIPTGKFW